MGRAKQHIEKRNDEKIQVTKRGETKWEPDE